ncbi:MAG: GNAT family N-acetyltransferase [Actinomycetota bacterium]
MVVPLDAAHDVGAFRCGVAALDDWLQRYALINQGLGGARTYVTCEGAVVRGYYALAVSSVEFATASRRMRLGLGRYPIPVILLARLAVDRRWQGRHVGEFLLRDALLRCLGVAREVRVRAVLVHAKDDTARTFYERFDFGSSPTDPYHLTVLIQDLEKAFLA